MYLPASQPATHPWPRRWRGGEGLKGRDGKGRRDSEREREGEMGKMKDSESWREIGKERTFRGGKVRETERLERKTLGWRRESIKGRERKGGEGARNGGE